MVSIILLTQISLISKYVDFLKHFRVINVVNFRFYWMILLLIASVSLCVKIFGGQNEISTAIVVSYDDYYRFSEKVS